MSKKRLLLIEDDYDVAEMLLIYFESQDYEVLHADNGANGIELARTRFPNLILLDVMLPDMDGYDICYQLRSAGLTKYIPTLFLTQRDERASKVRGLELGADDYITKPFDIDELRLRVQGAINRATRENLHESRTGLPTGTMVTEELSRVEDAGEAYTSFTLAIEGFNAFTDVYGFVAGNEVLNYTGNIVRTTIAEKGTPNDFIGIIDDRLVVITHAEEPESVETAIVSQFNEQARAFYSFEDADRGGVLVNEGESNEKLVPLMTLTAHQGKPVFQD